MVDPHGVSGKKFDHAVKGGRPYRRNSLKRQQGLVLAFWRNALARHGVHNLGGNALAATPWCPNYALNLDNIPVNHLFTGHGVSVVKVSAFFSNDSGAVTVDWTVLAAAVVGLGVSTVGAVRTGVVSLGGDINGSLSSANVASLGALGSGGALAAAEGVSMSFPIASSDEDFADWLADLEDNDQESLNRLYQMLMMRVARYESSGDAARGVSFLDQAAAVHQTLTDRGHDIPDADISLEDAYTAIVG